MLFPIRSRFTPAVIFSALFAYVGCSGSVESLDGRSTGAGGAGATAGSLGVTGGRQGPTGGLGFEGGGRNVGPVGGFISRDGGAPNVGPVGGFISRDGGATGTIGGKSAGGTGGAPTGGQATSGGQGNGDPHPTTGSLDVYCTDLGAYACAGHAQKGQLACAVNPSIGVPVWSLNGNCSGANNCDTRPGGNAGSCQPIVTECLDKNPGAVFCRGVNRLTCGPDLVTATPLDTCATGFLCTDGMCVIP